MARAPKDEAAAAAGERDASELPPEELTAQIAQLKAEIAALSAGLKAKGVEFAADLKARGEQAAGEARSRAGHALADAEVAVRQNPATAMAVAAGLGFLVGLLLNRR